MDREKDSKTERKGGPSGDILPDNARKEDDEDTGTPSCQPRDPVQKETDPGSVSRHDRKEESVRSGEAEKKQTESLLNIPRTEDEEKEEEEEMASDKHEEEVKRDEIVQPQITVPVNNKDTGKPSFQPPDPVQKETDPGSVSRHDRKEESVRSGEAEKKQTEKTTEKQHHSGTEPKIDTEGEICRKPEKSEDLSGDSLSVNEPKEDGPSGDILPDNAQSPLNIPKTEDEEKEEEEEMASNKHEEEVKRDEIVQPQITVPVNNKDTGKPSFQPPDPVQKETDPGSVSRHDRKEESVRSSEAEKKQTEKTTEKQHHSGTEPKIDTEGEICHKPEKSEDLSGDSLSVNEPKEDGPSGDILPDDAQSLLNIPRTEDEEKEEEEEMASDKHEEEVKRDEIVQPQITVPVNNKDTGKPSFQPPDPVQKETDPGSVSRHDRKEESVRSGEAEKKQTEKTTEKQHHSGTEPKIDTEGEICRKPEKSEDLSGDSLSVNEPKEDGPSGDILPDNAQSLLNIPRTEDEEKEEEEEMASNKHEEEVKRDEIVQPQITVPVNNKDTGKPSFQPPDPVQKETDPGSVSRHDRKEESVRSSEAEKKQTEKTTEKQHHSGTEPKIDTEGEICHKPEKSEDLSGDSLSVNEPKEDGPSGDILPDDAQSLLNIPRTEDEEKEEEEEMASDKHEEEVKRDEIVQPQITVPVNNKDTGKPSFQPPDPVQKETDPGSVSRHDRKEESVRSGEAEKKQTEKTTEKQHHSGTEPKIDTEGEICRKPEKSEDLSGDSLSVNEPKEDGPSGDILPDDAQSLLNIPKTEEEEEEEEEMASDKHEEEVKRDENVQPQITVPVNNKTIWTTAVVILIAVVCALCQRSPDSTSSKTKEVNVVDLFNQEMKKLETTFPNQHPELWRRSLIHLRRHLKTKNPTEPVSLILTSDRRAEKTLGCLAVCLARAFSTAHNSSVLKINGKNKASQDSDQVKLDIDSELRKAFEGKKSAAVIHHFEELPPGSTLIFYRYCDHENAAYKDVFLAFTVMLDAEVELPSSVSLGRVEEMVQEHIKHKFVSSDKSAMFNQMDVDKLGGLWSRISHLILPVAAEKKFEEQGCGDWD
ncbi:trichohyalin [Carassius gibelio]|uniref:trichohyalin n=1 Tax=Carassius gibelio TaxID=101364 RepID=UPI00227982AC|nr:trichohyalin [Carassius gibelio]